MNVSFVLLGTGFSVLGVVGLVRPGWLIKGRGEWARLLTRPFMHGRVIGGQVDPEDPFQRLMTRVIGVMFLVFGISIVVVGLRELNWAAKR